MPSYRLRARTRAIESNASRSQFNRSTFGPCVRIYGPMINGGPRRVDGEDTLPDLPDRISSYGRIHIMGPPGPRGGSRMLCGVAQSRVGTTNWQSSTTGRMTISMYLGTYDRCPNCVLAVRQGHLANQG